MNANVKTISHESTVRLVMTSIMLALASVLSMVTIFKMPLGGSITPVSMLPICVISIMYGVKWGLGSAFAYALIQLGFDFGAAFSWGLSAKALIVCFIFDYLLAFTSLGFSGIFRKKGSYGICIGIGMAMMMRFLCHVISGGTVFAIWCKWSNAWLYSICYNGAFMLPEMLITMIVAILLFKTSYFSNKLQ